MILTSHLHEKSHRKKMLQTRTNRLQGDTQKQVVGQTLISLPLGGGHTLGRTWMMICLRHAGPVIQK